MELKDKVIVITGGSQGLGKSMAITLAQCGAQLALVDINGDKVAETARYCHLETGSKVRGYQANVADEDAVVGLFNQVEKDFGRIDGLINNAGTNADALLVKKSDSGLQKMSLDDFSKVIAVDLTGVFLCGREAAAHMVQTGNEGVIINISSIVHTGNAGQTNYAAAKAGVSAMTVTWAQELSRYGIRVAGIAPGFSDTQMVAKMRQDMQEKVKQRIPLHRFARPDEIADAALFILENDYYNGRILEIDGGLRV